LRPTRAGWLFFAITLGVGFAAMNTGNNLLYMVLSLLLAFLVLSGVLSESALRGLSVRRRLPRELFAGAPAPVGIEIHNAQRRVPSFAIVVEDLLAGGSPAGRVFALRVGPGGTVTRSYALTPAARGELAFRGFRVATRFPFGLFSKAMRLDVPGAALVYPAIAPAPLARETQGRETGESAVGTRGESASAASLRAFAPGDSHRRVHWRASWRRGQLLVREREGQQRSQHVVTLRTRGATPGEAFERAVRRAASDAVAHLAAGWRVGLRTDATRVPPAEGPAHRRRLLGLLARVAPEMAAAADAAPRGRAR
jgi:uncharacterized protein (DUF58 family)